MAGSWDHTLAGGHPVLDFVNTVDDWTQPNALDYLETFADAARFAEAVGIVSPREASNLSRAANASRSVPNGPELTALRRLRASLERMFRASVDGRPAQAADIAVVRRDFIEAARAATFVTTAGAPLARRISVDVAGPAALRLRLVDAAMTLLQSEALHHVKVCPTCGWYFLDVSKNQSRVWCSMETCGARAKARRYYHRSKRGRARAQLRS
jgi:predicted RNA-binding Zn ribbon-like protein